MQQAVQERPYHHGNLRRALLEEAVDVIAEQGPTMLSLRDLARRLGVSHGAPAHHFGDKAGLLTAVATEGFRLLAAELREAYADTGDVLEVGVAYVRFAVRHRPYFEVMFRLDLYRTNDPELAEAREQAREILYAPFARLSSDGSDDDNLNAGVAAWSLVHGLAALFLSGNLPSVAGKDPEEITRMIAPYLFRKIEPGETPT
jgi:AcrR family transcriptional regulator